MSSPSSSPLRRVYVITGSNTGVGFQSARLLALGSSLSEPRHIILACRTAHKAEAAVAKIQAELPNSTGEDGAALVEWLQLDVTDLESIKRFVHTFSSERGLPCHVLVNNAGVNLAPKKLAQPLKCEGMFVSNYLGGYMLTKLLMPTLIASAPSRVINVTSYMHRLGKTNFEEQMRGKTGVHTYSSTKLAQIYHAHELARRYGGAGVSVFLAHPGACNSDIWVTLKPEWMRSIVLPLSRAMFLTTEQGAASSVHAATLPVSHEEPTRGEVRHFGPYRQLPCPGLGLLFDGWQPSSFSKVTESKTSSLSYNRDNATKLWQLSEKLCEEWEQAAQSVKEAEAAN